MKPHLSTFSTVQWYKCRGTRKSMYLNLFVFRSLSQSCNCDNNRLNLSASQVSSTKIQANELSRMKNRLLPSDSRCSDGKRFLRLISSIFLFRPSIFRSKYCSKRSNFSLTSAWSTWILSKASLIFFLNFASTSSIFLYNKSIRWFKRFSTLVIILLISSILALVLFNSSRTIFAYSGKGIIFSLSINTKYERSGLIFFKVLLFCIDSYLIIIFFGDKYNKLSIDKIKLKK
ncbi:unnamed protein product [Mycoplasma amphoriforme A39]|uniref:Uncharacterized protein n=1 Tax=Mycoplasma amphoriforme A39 TaxID=572419 RepID=A0A292IJ58_9MOLU|nr:unnamed protein product [Mycoplasma amphoriforme A39]